MWGFGNGMESLMKISIHKSDKEIADTLNNLSKASDLSAIHTFVKNHSQEILMVIGLALQVVQIVVAI